MQDDELDKYLLDVLLANYENVYVWLQAIEDYNQLQRMGYGKRVQAIAPTLEAYNTLLKNEEIDYIGTRLHGGIHALNNEKRILIIAVDNRAKEISKDTNLPVIDREKVKERLESMINGSWKTKTELPTDNINRWKAQFIIPALENNGRGYSLTAIFIVCIFSYSEEVCA